MTAQESASTARLRGKNSSVPATATAFLGKLAPSTMTGAPHIDWGPQPFAFAGTEAWVLPNPSGLNRAFTRDALVSAYSQLRQALTNPKG